MVGTLIESRGQAPRRGGGSLASMVVHGVLIAAAIFATAGHDMAAFPLKDDGVIIVHPFFQPPPTPARSAPASTPPSSSVAAMPQLPVIRVPSLTPTELPAIDLTAMPTPPDFSELRARSRSSGCEVACPRVGTGVEGSDAPVWAVSDVMTQLRERPIPPRYPERLRQAGVDGSVLVTFAVDTLGRVDPASVEVLRSTHELFTQAVREALGKLRFNPATAGSRKVPVLAMMPFHFRLK